MGASWRWRRLRWSAVLFLRLPDGERAVLLRPAQASVAPLLQEDEWGFALELGGVRVPLCESW